MKILVTACAVMSASIKVGINYGRETSARETVDSRMLELVALTICRDL